MLRGQPHQHYLVPQQNAITPSVDMYHSIPFLAAWASQLQSQHEKGCGTACALRLLCKLAKLHTSLHSAACQTHTYCHMEGTPHCGACSGL